LIADGNIDKALKEMALSQQNGNYKGHHDTLKSLGLGIKGKDKIALNKISLKLRN